MNDDVADVLFGTFAFFVITVITIVAAILLVKSCNANVAERCYGQTKELACWEIKK